MIEVLMFYFLMNLSVMFFCKLLILILNEFLVLQSEKALQQFKCF